MCTIHIDYIVAINEYTRSVQLSCGYFDEENLSAPNKWAIMNDINPISNKITLSFCFSLFFSLSVSVSILFIYPFGARLHESRSTSYHGESNFSALLTPITFLISYTNSAINPLLYAFLSRNFRKGMREIILCSFKKGKNKSSQQRIPLHVSKSVF